VKVGILGSGLGLYGYLPAIVRQGAHVVMPKRYRERLQNRDDVRCFGNNILWASDEREMLEISQALVVALRPMDQVEWVKRGIEAGRIDRYLLEKPVAPDPRQGRDLLNKLSRSGCGVRIGFIFRNTPWAEQLRAWLGTAGADGKLTVDWRFRAHHYANGLDIWKRRPSQGGGVVNFYGIHLIALLAELGYRRVLESYVECRENDDAHVWRASFGGERLPACHVGVYCDADETTYSLQGDTTSSKERLAIALSDPFDGVAAGGRLDRRVDILSDLCRSFLECEPRVLDYYFASVELWAEVEDRTNIVLKKK
jgi:predicted dehydrogenase